MAEGFFYCAQRANCLFWNVLEIFLVLFSKYIIGEVERNIFLRAGFPDRVYIHIYTYLLLSVLVKLWYLGVLNNVWSYKTVDLLTIAWHICGWKTKKTLNLTLALDKSELNSSSSECAKRNPKSSYIRIFVHLIGRRKQFSCLQTCVGCG